MAAREGETGNTQKHQSRIPRKSIDHMKSNDRGGELRAVSDTVWQKLQVRAPCSPARAVGPIARAFSHSDERITPKRL